MIIMRINSFYNPLTNLAYLRVLCENSRNSQFNSNHRKNKTRIFDDTYTLLLFQILTDKYIFTYIFKILTI